jgi:hypothetical protein
LGGAARYTDYDRVRGGVVLAAATILVILLEDS